MQNAGAATQAYFRGAKSGIEIKLFSEAVSLCQTGLKCDPTNKDLPKLEEKVCQRTLPCSVPTNPAQRPSHPGCTYGSCFPRLKLASRNNGKRPRRSNKSSGRPR
eukprot:8640239-Pyramimonas_sp.AAC.1